MIQLQDVGFAYAQGDFRLQIGELSIAAGERVCWIGPSGSGKTTLLHLVAGIVSPSEGRIESCGVELTSQSDAARRDFRIANIGLVFQDFALLDYLDVLDNILLPYRINRSLQLEPPVRARARRLAEGLGLAELLSRRPTQLSQGERQRVAVCRALVTHPKMLLADEPTANLDPSNATHVLDALDAYAKEQQATLVVVTHDQEVQERLDGTIDVSSFCAPSQAKQAEGSDNG